MPKKPQTAIGKYVHEEDVDNWPADYGDPEQQAVIDRIEEQVERLTKDCFYPKAFDVRIDGNGSNRIFPSFYQDLLWISNVYVNDIEIGSSEWEYDKNSVYSSILAQEYQTLLEDSHLFPAGKGNVRIVGMVGLPERLDIDGVSGTFVVGETITGGASTATAIIKEITSTYLKIVGRSSTNFNSDEQVAGGTSGATANVNNTSGAVNDPPKAIAKACIILCRYDNDTTLYTKYYKGTEKMGDYSYSTTEKPLAGIREADVLIRPYVRKKPMIGVV